jgi:hypothetical protein
MRKSHLVLVAAGLMTTGLATANESDSAVEAKPIELTNEQMDSVTAAGGNAYAYGKVVIEATSQHQSFGQLIGAAKRAGQGHENYAGGVKALVELVLDGAHPVP